MGGKTMATVLPEGYAAPAAADDTRFFFRGAIVMAFVIVAGFSFQLLAGRSTFRAPPLLHAHALLFMTWVGFYVVQNTLVATGSVALHRRLGWLSVALIPAMVVMGALITTDMLRGGRTPFFFMPAHFLFMDMLIVLSFAALVAAAIAMRRQTRWHRRLMFCGMAMLTGPAVGRLLPMPLLIPYAPLAVFAVLLLFPIAGVIADLRREGRVHPAWLWGIGAMAVTQIAMEVLPRTSLGIGLYAAVVAGSPGAAAPALEFPAPPPLIAGQ